MDRNSLMHRLNRVVVLVILAVSSGCSMDEPQRVLHYDSGALQSEVEPELKLPKKPITGKFIYDDSPEVQKAIEEYLKTGKAATIKKTGFIQYPFEESEPIIFCQRLRVCDIELKAGEEVLSIIEGDKPNWVVRSVYSGEDSVPVPHIAVKPKEFATATNIIVYTNERTYYVALLAKDEEYVRQFKFYYPREEINNAATLERIKHDAEKKERQGTVDDLPMFSIKDIGFNYKIQSDDDVPWRPVRAFEAAGKVYIQMPTEMKTSEAPSLLIKRHNDSSVELVNYRLRHNYFIVDKVFDEAMLVTGTGSSKGEVRIVRK